MIHRAFRYIKSTVRSSIYFQGDFPFLQLKCNQNVIWTKSPSTKLAARQSWSRPIQFTWFSDTIFAVCFKLRPQLCLRGPAKSEPLQQSYVLVLIAAKKWCLGCSTWEHRDCRSRTMTKLTESLNVGGVGRKTSATKGHPSVSAGEQYCYPCCGQAPHM